MEMSFKEVGTVLAEQFGIEDKRSAAFRSRLQHLQRAGVPAGVNTGKGKRASYSWPQLIELIVVLDLINIGLSPEAARIAVEDHREAVLSSAAVFGTLHDEKTMARWAKERTSPFEHAIVLQFSAATLLKSANGGVSYLDWQTGRNFSVYLADREPYVPLGCLLVLSDRILQIINSIPSASMYVKRDDPLLDTARSFKAWADDLHSSVVNVQ